MTRNYPEWAHLVDESGPCWYNLANGTRVPLDGGGEKPPSRALYAIPSRDLVSHPHWVSSKDSAIISEVISVENERIGVKADSGPGRITDWKPVEINGSRTLVQSVAIPWAFDGITGGPTEFTDFLPQYSLFKPPGNAIVLWKEAGNWVAGYSRGSRWAHVQLLGEVDPDSLAGEIQLTVMELSAKGIIEEIECIVVWAPFDEALQRELESGEEIPVSFESPPSPATTSAPDWSLEPSEISLARLARIRRKRAGLIATCFVLFLLLLTGAAFFHLWTLRSGNDRLQARVNANREAADTIEAAMEKWRALGPAIEPARFPVELFHQVSTLLPEKGFRLTAFEFQDHRTVIVRGEGSSMANALQMKGSLEKAETLSDYQWEIGPPRNKGDLTEFLAAGTYRF